MLPNSVLLLTILAAAGRGCGSFQLPTTVRGSAAAGSTDFGDGGGGPAKDGATAFAAAISGRKRFLEGVGTSFLVAACPGPSRAAAKSYSSNARNMERMNTGDMSGGSVYDNDPKTKAGKRRRAMVGCKSPVARAEAAEASLNTSTKLSEKECNQMVLGGESDFMLKALQKLDCPTCPYGISEKRM